MQISEVMTHSVITAPPGMSLALAQRLMHDHRIRHLPVVQEGQLVGLVSEETILADAGQLLLEHKTDCLPVLHQDSTLVGIVTVTDLLRAYVAFQQAGAATPK